METLTPLQKAQAVQAAKRAAGEKLVQLNPMQKAAANPTSLRAAINGKCASCVCWGADSNPRERIRNCGVIKCPLYAVRPYQRDDAQEAEAA
jgi:hypothetical protein